MARNCPQRNTVNTMGITGHAPGIWNNTIRLGPSDLAQLEQLASASKSLESLTLAPMAILPGLGNLDDIPGLFDDGSETSSDNGGNSNPGSLGSDDDTEIEVNYNSGQPGAAPTNQRRDGVESLPRFMTTSLMEDPIGAQVEFNVPYDSDSSAPRQDQGGGRFVSYRVTGRRWLVWDSWWADTEEEHFLSLDRVLHQSFNLGRWYRKIWRKRAHPRDPTSSMIMTTSQMTVHNATPVGSHERHPVWDITNLPIWCCAQWLGDPDPATIQRNAARTKDFTRKVPRPVVVVVRINGHPTRALIDSKRLEVPEYTVPDKQSRQTLFRRNGKFWQEFKLGIGLRMVKRVKKTCSKVFPTVFGNPPNFWEILVVPTCLNLVKHSLQLHILYACCDTVRWPSCFFTAQAAFPVNPFL